MSTECAWQTVLPDTCAVVHTVGGRVVAAAPLTGDTSDMQYHIPRGSHSLVVVVLPSIWRVPRFNTGFFFGRVHTSLSPALMFAVNAASAQSLCSVAKKEVVVYLPHFTISPPLLFEHIGSVDIALSSCTCESHHLNGLLALHSLVHTRR